MVSGEQAIVNQLCKLVDEFTEVKKLLRASEDRIIDVFYVTIPEAGGTRSFSVGITKIDFKTGAITNPDGTVDTLTRRLDLTQDKDFMHSISIHSNHEVKFRLDSAGQQSIDAQFLFQLPYVTYTTLEIECTIETEISIFACTNPQATLGNFKVSDMTQQTILGDGVELDTYDSITSLLSNLNRIRYQIKILSGEVNWDDAPDTDLSSIDAIVTTHEALSIDVHGVGVGNSVASDDDIATHEADTSVHGVAEVADKATVSTEIDNDITTHAAVSVNVHGVGVGNSVASDEDIATHEADTSVHGVAEVADKATVSTEIDNDITTHAAVSVNVHGVGVGNSVASDDDIATHEADTSVHGVAEVADKATVSTEIDNDITTHAAVSVNVHGVGVGNDVASSADIATHANDASTHGVSGTIQGSEDKNVANGIAGLDASAKINNGLYAGIEKTYQISDNLLHSHDAEASTTSGTWVKKKTITINNLYPTPSTIRIKFDMKSSSANTANGKIYKNGGGFGTQRTKNNTTWTTFSEDLSFADGDDIQLYIWANSTTAYVRNLRIYGVEHDLTLSEAISQSDPGAADAWNATNSTP